MESLLFFSWIDLHARARVTAARRKCAFNGTNESAHHRETQCCACGQQYDLYVRALRCLLLSTISSVRLDRSTFITELFPDDGPASLANNPLLAVDLGQLTIRSDGGDRTFQELLSKFRLDDAALILSLK